MLKTLTTVLALSSSYAAAAEFSGTITNSSQQPIANAKIELHGSSEVIYTDAEGKFVLNSGEEKFELHVSAAGYTHENFNFDGTNNQVAIVLSENAMEYIDVYSTPLHASALESATPITVLSGEELQRNHADTLGETLKSQVGVHSTYYGPTSASPIIRGLDGPRVLITQNSLDAGDASRVGPDHVVSTETSTVKQVEILRGPATLIFGNGAIGGVVNIVDNRVPTSSDFELDWSLGHNTVSDQNEASFNFTSGTDKWAYHIDAFTRSSDNIEIPEDPEHHEGESEEEHEEHEEEFDGTLENSAADSSGFNVGTSYLLDNGFVGVSFGKLEKVYGIPGHSHGDEEHDEHEEDHDEHEEEEHHEEHGVEGDMEQQRVQLLSELSINKFGIEALHSKVGITEYRHAEIEEGVEGTVFTNDSQQAKFDVLLQEKYGWHSALTLDYKSSDFKAIGEEAFTPASETTSTAIAFLTEKHFGDVLVQLGARIENVTMDTVEYEIDAEIFGEHEEHDEEHDEHEGEDDHGHDEDHDDEHEEHEEMHLEPQSYSFNPTTLSASLVWDFTKGQNVAIAYTHSERAPSASEVFAYGPHIGTGSYEVGALFDIHEEDEEIHVETIEHDLDLETANNLELTYRRFSGDFAMILNVFYNQVNNYYYQSNTGLFAESEHAHDEHEEEAHDESVEGHEEEHEEAGLPVYLTQAADATFYGFESQFVWQLNPELEVKLQNDFIVGELDSGEYLPRIPPARLGLITNYQGENISANFEVMHNFEQTKVAELETETDAYTLINFSASYHFELASQDLSANVKVTNLTDEVARVHTSYLKDVTMLPGRGVSLTLRGMF